MYKDNTFLTRKQNISTFFSHLHIFSMKGVQRMDKFQVYFLFPTLFLHKEISFENEKKKRFSFAFCSLTRTFALKNKLITIQAPKKHDGKNRKFHH